MKMTTDDLRMSVHQAGFSHANLIIKTPPSHHYFDRSSVLTSTHCSHSSISKIDYFTCSTIKHSYLEEQLPVSKMFPDLKRGFIVDFFNCLI